MNGNCRLNLLLPYWDVGWHHRGTTLDAGETSFTAQISSEQADFTAMMTGDFQSELAYGDAPSLTGRMTSDFQSELAEGMWRISPRQCPSGRRVSE